MRRLLLLGFICLVGCDAATMRSLTMKSGAQEDDPRNDQYLVSADFKGRKFVVQVKIYPFCHKAPTRQIYLRCHRRAKLDGTVIRIETANLPSPLSSPSNKIGRASFDFPLSFFRLPKSRIQKLSILINGRKFAVDKSKMADGAHAARSQIQESERRQKYQQVRAKRIMDRIQGRKRRNRALIKKWRKVAISRGVPKTWNFAQSQVSLKGTINVWEEMRMGWKVEKVKAAAAKKGWRVHKIRQIKKCRVYEVIFDDFQGNWIAITFYRGRAYWIEMRPAKTSPTITQGEFLSFVNRINNKYHQGKGRLVPHGLGMYTKWKWQIGTREIQITARQLYTRPPRVRVFATLLLDNTIKAQTKRCFAHR